MTEPTARISPDVESFYALRKDGLASACCQGTACFVARHTWPEHWREATAQASRVYCLGKCYAGPARATTPCRLSARISPITRRASLKPSSATRAPRRLTSLPPQNSSMTSMAGLARSFMTELRRAAHFPKCLILLTTEPTGFRRSSRRSTDCSSSTTTTIEDSLKGSSTPAPVQRTKLTFTTATATVCLPRRA